MKIKLLYNGIFHICETRDFTKEEAIELIKLDITSIIECSNLDNLSYKPSELFIEDYFSIVWFKNNTHNILFTMNKDHIVKIINYFLNYSDNSVESFKFKCKWLINNLDKLINEACIKNIIE